MNVLWIGHRLGILLLAVTAIEPVAALWWWAVFGMSEPVATAHIFTPFVTFGAGCTLVMFCDSPGTFRSGAEPRDIEAPSQIGRQLQEREQ